LVFIQDSKKVVVILFYKLFNHNIPYFPLLLIILQVLVHFNLNYLEYQVIIQLEHTKLVQMKIYHSFNKTLIVFQYYPFINTFSTYFLFLGSSNYMFQQFERKFALRQKQRKIYLKFNLRSYQNQLFLKSYLKPQKSYFKL